jgi:hypothetical protein
LAPGVFEDDVEGIVDVVCRPLRQHRGGAARAVVARTVADVAEGACGAALPVKGRRVPDRLRRGETAEAVAVTPPGVPRLLPVCSNKVNTYLILKSRFLKSISIKNRLVVSFSDLILLLSACSELAK